MTFDLTLPADHPQQPTPAGSIGDTTDLELMLRLWNANGPDTRAKALRIADQHRKNAIREERK